MNKKIFTIIYLIFSVLLLMATLFVCCLLLKNPVIEMAIFLCLETALFAGYLVFCAIKEEQIKSDRLQKFNNKVFTEMDSDGNYTIKVEDLYEAIEKLGYLEHEEE